MKSIVNRIIVFAMFVFIGCTSVTSSGYLAKFSAPMGEGTFTATIDNDSYSVDYTVYDAKVEMTHRLNTGGMACVGHVKVSLAGEDETCKLVLDFSPDFSGAMILQEAEFHAKSAVYQDDFPIDSYPCPVWADESSYAKGHKRVIYEMTGGEASLSVKPLLPPAAGQQVAKIKNYVIDPKGVVNMKFKGRQFKLDLTDIKIIGDVTSKGSKDVACAQKYLPLPEVILKDFNPKSPTYNEDIDVSSAFQGKFVVVHMGAGW